MSKHYRTLAEASEAAIALGITIYAEYNVRYKEDARLPSAPSEAYQDEWQGIRSFLGRSPRGEFYETLAEASEAAIALGIRTSKEYKNRYKEDDKLPSHPESQYKDDWQGYREFLGVVKFYSTLAEASEAAIALGITTYAEYNVRYNEDARLPSAPSEAYRDEWQGIRSFLGRPPRGEFYETLAEASEAAIALGITTYAEYTVRYKEDSRLPSMLKDTYRDEWQGIRSFLGLPPSVELYETLAEASEAAIALGIKHSGEYKKRNKEDDKLPTAPYLTYRDDWENWGVFLDTENNDRLEEFVLTHPNWVRVIRGFVDNGLSQDRKMNHGYHFLNEVIIGTGLGDQPGACLHKSNNFPQEVYTDFINSKSATQKRSCHNLYIALMEYILLVECSEEDDDSGEVIRLEGYRNPLITILKSLLDELPYSRPDQSVKPVLPMSIIDRARNYLFPNEAKSLSDTKHLPELFSACWVEIDEGLIDVNDPNCIWRKQSIADKENGRESYSKDIFQIWSPVRAIAIYTLLQTPLRGQQIMWLDSGEGDTEIPTIENGEVIWKENKLNIKSPTRRMMGFLQKTESGNKEDRNEFGMYVTTNKTGKIVGGYKVSWMPHNLAYWIIVLRDWQIKYNPLNVLTRWEDIKIRRTNIKILKARGVQAFLFRNSSGDKFSPMSTTSVLAKGLPRVLYAIQRDGEDLATKLEGKPLDKRYKSDFTPHCMRTSLITAYIVDGKAPIHIISKLVGHASIVMTIYYTKIGHTAMRQELGLAEKRAMKDSVSRYQDIIIDHQINTIKSELIATDKSFLDHIDNEWPASSYQFTDKWICAMGGGACDSGGEAVVDTSTNKLYAPVPQGYLGKRNCIRCRFAITGPAFIGGLQSLANEIFLEIESTRSEYNELERQITSYRNEKYDSEVAGVLFRSHNELSQAQAIFEEKALKLDMYFSDIQALNSKIEQSGKLLNTQGDNKNTQLIVDSAIEFSPELSENESSFRLLANICSDAEIYASASASRAAPLLATMLDNFADNNGLQPSMFRLSEKQKLKVANQITRLMMSKLNGDWGKADKLIRGSILLKDFTIEDKLIHLGRSIEDLMHGVEGSQVLEKIND